MELTILIGAPGSGKSTYAATLKNNSTIILSSDAIRETLCGSAEDQSRNKDVFDTLYECMNNAFDEGFNVVFDATNMTRKARANALKIAKRYNCKVKGVIFVIPYEECCRRIDGRERKVPAHIVNKFLNSFEPPTREEGFNEVIVID